MFDGAIEDEVERGLFLHDLIDDGFGVDRGGLVGWGGILAEDFHGPHGEGREVDGWCWGCGCELDGVSEQHDLGIFAPVEGAIETGVGGKMFEGLLGLV
ncbi:MAG: hypothetical protein RI897_2165 [Verrucomicrobiota bacterium]